MMNFYVFAYFSDYCFWVRNFSFLHSLSAFSLLCSLVSFFYSVGFCLVWNDATQKYTLEERVSV